MTNNLLLDKVQGSLNRNAHSTEGGDKMSFRQFFQRLLMAIVVVGFTANWAEAQEDNQGILIYEDDDDQSDQPANALAVSSDDPAEAADVKVVLDYVAIAAYFIKRPYFSEEYVWAASFERRLFCDYISIVGLGAISRQKANRRLGLVPLTEDVMDGKQDGELRPKFTRATVSLYGGLGFNLGPDWFRFDVDFLAGGFSPSQADELEDDFHRQFTRKPISPLDPWFTRHQKGFQGFETMTRASLDIRALGTRFHFWGYGLYNAEQHNRHFEARGTIAVWNDPDSLIQTVEVGGGFIYDRLRTPNMIRLKSAGISSVFTVTDWCQVSCDLFYGQEDILAGDDNHNNRLKSFHGLTVVVGVSLIYW